MSHPTDVDLAALVDGAAPEQEAAAARAHLEGCADCRRREAELLAAASRVAEAPAPNPAIAVAVLDAIERGDAVGGVRWLKPAGWLGAGAAAGVAAMLWVTPVVPGGDAPATELSARGAPTGATAPSGVKLRPEVLTAEGWRPLEGRASVIAQDGRPSLRVALDVLAPPKRPSFVVAYARDADGAVTWLRPTWADASDVPLAEAAPTAVGPGAPPLHVTLEKAAKVLEVTVAELGAATSLDALDRLLERGGELSDGGAPVVWSTKHWLRVHKSASVAPTP